MAEAFEVMLDSGALWLALGAVVCIVLVVTASLVLHGHVRQRSIGWWLRGLFALAALAMAVPRPAIQYGAAAAAIALFLILRRDARAAELRTTG